MLESLLVRWTPLRRCDSFTVMHKSLGHNIHPDSSLGEHPVSEFVLKIRKINSK